eukprot:gene8162-9589_t
MGIDLQNPYAHKTLVLYLTIAPWDDRQTINVDSHTEIGEITVFYKQTGKSVKIRDLEGYALFKELDNNVASSSKRKRVQLANEQSLITYNITSNSHLELQQVTAREDPQPRWFYKAIVPSNQLEPLLRESLVKSRSNSVSTAGVSELIDDIKSTHILTIDSPKKAGSLTPLQWQHASPSSHSAKRVLDVVQRIEAAFPAMPVAMAARWEARITASDDAFVKRLAMDDSLGGELVKQEYIEFSLRFEGRTSLLLGAEHAIVVWLDPIQSFFTLAFSANTCVHDALTLLVQYIYPSETFNDMVPNYGLYLAETAGAKPLALQHKQMLLNCKLNNIRLEDSVFIFKAKSNPNHTTVRPTAPTHLPDAAPVHDDLDDEGYNLTVLFPSHQTYRQFHLNPHKTVNETIASIVSATTPHTPPARASPTFSSQRNSYSKALSGSDSPRGPPPEDQQSNNQSLPFNEKQNTIFGTADETAGYCLYFQKNGSGVWMEGYRTLLSYNLPNDAVVEFKSPPNIVKMALIEGTKSTIKLYYNLQTYLVVYGRYTLLTDLRELVAKHCTSLSPEEAETHEIYLVRDAMSECLAGHDSFESLQINSNRDEFLEFKPSPVASASLSFKDSLLAFVATKEPTLIPGEVIIYRRDGDRIVGGHAKKGSVFLTSFRLIFNAYNRSSYDDHGTKDDCEIPVASISRIKHSNQQTEIHCKDFRVASFLTGESTLWERLKSNVDIQDITRIFAFSNAEPFDPSFDTIYNVEDEYIRLGFPIDKWRITYINKDYGLCPTYPSLFVVPESVTDEDLKKISLFREKGRSGTPMANAKANTLMGKGHEDTSLYQNVELQFLGIGNIHVMRDSYKKLYALIQNPETSNWLSQLDSTLWLEHIYQLINSANIVVEMVDKKGSSVLTHCSDGWDRTSQLVALSQLLLDPYYRTLRGFQILIEKEWLAFGHQFTHRCAHVSHPGGDEEASPIFLMFIDSVWQLTNLFPTTFQFNERFLVVVMEAVYNCKYGTFLFNNQRERLVYTKLNGGLASVWPAINSRAEEYTNFFYIENPKPIFHNFYLSDIQFWSNYYLRWHDNYRPKTVIDGTILRKVEEIRSKRNINQTVNK